MSDDLKTKLDLEKAWASMAEGQQFIPGLNPNDDVGDEPEERAIIHKVDGIIKHYIFWENSYEVDRTITSILERRIQRRQSLVDRPAIVLGHYYHSLKDQVVEYINEADPSLVPAMKKIEKYADLEDLTGYDDIVKNKVIEIIKKSFPEQLETAFI